MAKGKVKWFNNAKGYGFVLSDDGGDDLFAHYSSIQMDGYKTLKAGQPVEFDVQKGPKGSHAVNIRSATEVDDSLLDHPTPSEHAEREQRTERAHPHTLLAESP